MNLIPSWIRSGCFFDLRKETIAAINERIMHAAESAGVTYFDKAEYICRESQKTCDGASPECYKTPYDYGPYTLAGTRYFCARIHELGWLVVD